ncbi:MAG TPA: YncE family protein [Acidobacteriaceae bacterium]|nr:YncE family protein [Acidobacteriaceae bacterium]
MRFLLAAAALCLCPLAAAQTSTHILDVSPIPTDGHPSQAIFTPDGQYILVTVTHEHRLGSGIEVFHIDGDRIKRIAYNPLGAEPAGGILLIPNSRTVAVGFFDAGVAFLPLDSVLQGNAAAHIIPQGDHAGSGDLAVTPDGQTLFVANEFLRGGSVGVISLRRDPKGQLAPVGIGEISTQLVTPGIAISPDGTRLYATNELLPEHQPERLPGHANPDLQHGNCVQDDINHPMQNGGLSVIDTAKAAAPTKDFSPQQERHATLAVINAGCSPMHEAVSSDGRTVYLTAQGDNKVLVFNTAALEHDPEHALVRTIDTSGEAPVGLALFDHDRKLLVANSNRFTDGPGNAAVIDLTIDPDKQPVIQTIKTGDFPRSITASPDGRTLLLTVYLADKVLLLTMK